jgi:N4-gp56 family major capsid protein
MSLDLTSGMHWTSGNPNWQRDYYSLLLLETLRTKSLMVPFCAVKEDFAAAKSGKIVYTEVFDTEPNWNALSEDDIWLRGAHLDTRTVTIDLEIHGDMLKYSDYSEVVQYVNSGNMRGLVSNKIGQNQVDYLDTMARNAFLAQPNKIFAGSQANRAALTSGDLFDPNIAELARVHLEENEVPGVANPVDGASEAIIAIATPRVLYDIRNAAGSDWHDVNLYSQTGRKFRNEVGMWGGVRFLKTNRLRLPNAGDVTEQTTLSAEAKAGEGAAATVDVVYSPGQSVNKRYISVTDATSIPVGATITIHSQSACSSGEPAPEGDGTQESRRVVDKTGNDLSLNKPLLKSHASGDYVTIALDVHGTVFVGGPGVVYAVAERPHVVQPPKYDDLMMINRIGWRGFLKFQMFRPEFFEVAESAGSTV